jgi:hypothetical protein
MNHLLRECDAIQAQVRGLIEAKTEPDAGPRLFRKAMEAGALSGQLSPHVVAQMEHRANQMDRQREEFDYAAEGRSRDAEMMKSVGAKFRRGRLPLTECAANHTLIHNGLGHLLVGHWAV